MMAKQLGSADEPMGDIIISGTVKDASGNAKYYTKTEVDAKISGVKISVTDAGLLHIEED